MSNSPGADLIHFSCTECKAALSAPIAQAGGMLSCSACHAFVQIPLVVAAEKSAAAAPSELVVAEAPSIAVEKAVSPNEQEVPAPAVLSLVAWGDVYLGELKTGKCTVVAGKDFKKYLRDAMGDSALDVAYDEAGSCGKSVYITKKKGRKRWAAFETSKDCECFVKTSKVLEKSKE